MNYAKDQFATVKKSKVKLYSKINFYFKLFFSYITKNINVCMVKGIDASNFSVLLYIKASRSHVLYKLDELIYDLPVISNLTSEDASNVGFYYGLNYPMLSQNHFKYCFTINKSASNKYNLLSLDRKKNIMFSSNLNNTNKNFVMSPQEIFNSKAILNGFHPIQACYIGILTGMFEK